MNSKNQIKEILNSLKGKTIAIVYTFENDTPLGFKHFYTWKSSTISKWMIAVQNLYCLPYIVDVRTFIQKAINNTLPPIDFVINLNTGIYNLSTMALIPSVCSSMNIPCIPCDALTITAGENKEISNLIAKAINIRVPNIISSNKDHGIFRPINLGNSLGVTQGYNSQDKGIYQEFINGYEITTPLVYNPIKERMDILPTVIFYPINGDNKWYYDINNKTNQKGYTFILAELDNKLKEKYIELAEKLGIQTYCRIDARVKSDKLDNRKDKTFTLDETYFIEINVMPTIRDKNSFNYSFYNMSTNSSFSQILSILEENLLNYDLNTFLLACSLISFLQNH